ncbi:methionyl-tRNA formyltransferase [Thermosipho ferrireducens]|uniref:Methionyl-tRNA formyltransferase n=1 Tax=Thermosipho ferrireducens TaxID=2571116 RepID=A0ABX7S7M0_9BACT|nr:methionyl-tRNA formyltransferase [Thermosipho ferrireducens]QTA37110.1 methionyl-tRNA formyltransferase [Thermosipho ferrireducens]
MKILFLGTPEFAAEHLKYLLEKKYNVVGVISQPDKPRGRGKKLEPTPVKTIAQRFKIPVFQPKSLSKEGIKIIDETKPDIGIVVAYGKLLKQPFLDQIPFYNIHASLLPKYRGAAPIQRALENGENKTGITIFKIGEGMDNGPIALKKETKIGMYETYGELYEKLIIIGKELLIEFLEKYPLKLTPQDEHLATYAPKISKSDLKIDFHNSFEKVKNKIRAYDPFPGAQTFIHGKNVKVFHVFYHAPEKLQFAPGKIINISKEGATICCNDGIIKVKYIQFPGKKKITFFEAKNGKLIKEGDIFES